MNTEFPSVYVYKEFKHYIFDGELKFFSRVFFLWLVSLTVFIFCSSALENRELLEDAEALNTTLSQWVNQERFATFPKVTRGNIQQLTRTGKFLVLAVVEENKLEAIPPHMLE